MRKLLIALVAVCIAGSAAASSIDFGFGTNFYKPTGMTAENGQNFSVCWNLDSDVALGIYSEQSNVWDAAATTMRTLTVSAIQISKGVLKSVDVGINLGSGTCIAAGGATLVDIFGTVTILSGTGDKISGSLVASASARFSQADLLVAAGVQPADGANLGLGVVIGF